MIERLLVTFAIFALIGVAGIGIRWLVNARSSRLAAAVTVDPAESDGARLLLFSTRFCADCSIQRQVIEETRETWARPVAISYHDAVNEAELARQFGILTVPSIVVAAADGRVTAVRQGLIDEDRLRSLIETAA